MHNTIQLRRAILGISLSVVLVTSALAQSPAPEREKPKLRDFGSSLKQLKWDPKANATVETKPQKTTSTDEEDVVRVETTLVVNNLLVINKEGRPVQGLTRDDFIVTEDGKPQEVGVFSLADDAKMPRSIVLLIDYSLSQLPFIQTSVKAAKTLVDQLNPRDTMAIVTDDVELLVDFTRDKELLKEKLDSLEKKATSGKPHTKRFGRSAQYSALMAILKEAFDDEDQRPVIIFQTDGDELRYLRNQPIEGFIPNTLPRDLRERLLADLPFMKRTFQENVREFSLNDIARAAENSRATIYSIIPGYKLIGLSRDALVERYKASRLRSAQFSEAKPEVKALANEEFQRTSAESLKSFAEQARGLQLALAGVAKITGGWHDFLEDPSQADRVYSLILSDMNRRYVVGYYPINKERDGKRRQLSVEVRGHPEYVVWGRQSYYAPSPD